MSGRSISVVIPVRNAAGTLRECLDSVLAQSLRPDRILAVDDGSTDDSAAILESYGPQVTRLALDGRGAAAARNAALAQVKSDLVAFLDADDAWTPDRLQAGLSALEGTPGAALQFSDARLISGGVELPGTHLSGRWAERFDFERLLSDNFVCTSTAMAPREALLEAGPFDESLRIAHDYDLWLRLLRRSDCAAVARPLARYRVHPGGISQDAILALGETLEVLSRWRGLPPRGRLFSLLYTSGRLLLDAGRFEEARRSFAAAVGHRPWDARALAFAAATRLGKEPALALARLAGRGRTAA